MKEKEEKYDLHFSSFLFFFLFVSMPNESGIRRHAKVFIKVTSTVLLFQADQPF